VGVRIIAFDAKAHKNTSLHKKARRAGFLPDQSISELGLHHIKQIIIQIIVTENTEVLSANNALKCKEHFERTPVRPAGRSAGLCGVTDANDVVCE